MGSISKGIKYNTSGSVKFRTQHYEVGVKYLFATPEGQLFSKLDGSEINIQLETTALPEEPQTFAVTRGSLPSGLALSEDGVISGKLSSTVDTVNYYFTITATKTGGVSVSREFSATVRPDPAPVLPLYLTDDLHRRVAYASGNVRVVENTPFIGYLNTPLSPMGLIFSIESGTLPTGLTLDPYTGEIRGTTTNVSSYYSRTVVFVVTTPTGKSSKATHVFGVTKNTAPTITSPSNLGSGLGGSYFEVDISASDAEGQNITLSLAEGSTLPSGMVLVNNKVVGALPIAVEADITIPFTITASDGTLSSQKQLTITSIKNLNPVFNVATSYSLLTGGAINIPLTAVDPNGLSGITYVVDSSNLPEGVSYSTSTRRLTGIFAEQGEYTITITASNGELEATQEFVFSVAENFAPIWVTEEIPDLLATMPFFFQFEATDVNETPLTFMRVSGSLPSGTYLSPTGVWSGRPNQVTSPNATYTFTIRVSDGVYSVDRQFTVLVDYNDAPVFETPIDLGSANEGTAWASAPITAIDPEGQPITLSRGPGFPQGFAFDATTGIVSSSSLPEVSKDTVFHIPIDANDATGTVSGRSRVAYLLKVIFTKAPEWSMSAQLPKAVEKYAYTCNLVAANGGNNGNAYTMIGGTLPSGLTMSDKGVITGTVAPHAEDQTYSFTVRATNNTGQYADQTFTLLVEYNRDPVWQTESGQLLETYANNPVMFTLQANDVNNNVPLVYTSSNLPTGISLSSAGVLYGSTAMTETDVVQTFEVAVSDGLVSVTREFSIKTFANGDPIWTVAANLGRVLEDRVFSVTIAASDPERQPLAYAIVDGALPSGFTMSNNGAITGRAPMVSGDEVFTFTVEATDGVHVISREFSLTVEDNVAPEWQTPEGSIGTWSSAQRINYTFSAVDPNAQTVTYSLPSGSLPSGITLSTGGWMFGYLPVVNEDQVYTFTVRASDGVHYSDRTFTLTLKKNRPPVWISDGVIVEGDEQEDFEIDLMYEDPDGDDVTVSVSGTPAGWNLSQGKLRGKLPLVNETTTRNLTFTLSDGVHSVSKVLQYKVNFVSAPKWITVSTLPSVGEGSSVSVQLQSYYGGNSVIYSSSDLPNGLVITNSGHIYGTAPLVTVAQQTFTFTVTATNEFGSSTRTFSMVVKDNVAPTWQTASGRIAIGREETPFSVTVKATDTDEGAVVEYILVTPQEEVPFLTLDRETGEISGTLPEVTADRDYSVVIGATDGTVRVDRTFTIRVLNVLDFVFSDLIDVSPSSPATAMMELELEYVEGWIDYAGEFDYVHDIPLSANTFGIEVVPNALFDDMVVSELTIPSTLSSATQYTS